VTLNRIFYRCSHWILALLFCLPTLAFAADLPFALGEKINFRVGWGFVNAGTSSLEIADTLRVDGHLCVLIESRARSNDVLGSLYPVRDCISTSMDVEGLFSRGIKKKMREGGYRKDREFRMHPERSEVERYNKGEWTETREISGYLQDVLSAFYWVRKQDLEVGKILEVTAFDNFKTYPLAVKVLKREKIKVPGGRFDCFKIQPMILGEGLFKASGDIFIWLTADDLHLPVKMKSRIFIGSISAVMTSWEPGDPDSMLPVEE
jgi:hypothetical protein